MTLFWILAIALLAAVLPALLWPLWRAPRKTPALAQPLSNVNILRDQRAELAAELAGGELTAEQHEAAQAELERRVLEESVDADPMPAAPARSRTAAFALALGVPLIALGLYGVLGSPQGLDPAQVQAARPDGHLGPADVEAMVEKLAQRMQEQPDNAEGWALLGRSYNAMQRWDRASAAYARAVALVPGDAQLLADYADSLAMAQGQRLAGEPERLIERALKVDPRHLKALALAGSAAMERGDAKTAIDFWTRARAVAVEGSEFAAGLDNSLNIAREAAGLPAVATAAAPEAAAASGLSVNGEIQLAPALRARVQPGDTLYVYARAAEGPRMPLAIQRGGVGQWPVAFTLDDSMAMSPELKLSGFERVIVGARISRSGNATPQAGDLEGQSQPLKPGGAPIALVIDSVRP